MYLASHFRYLYPLMTVNRLTFFGEKFLGVFSRHDELSRHLPQEFYDQGDVICTQGFQRKNTERNHTRGSRHSTKDGAHTTL